MREVKGKGEMRGTNLAEDETDDRSGEEAGLRYDGEGGAAGFEEEGCRMKLCQLSVSALLDTASRIPRDELHVPRGRRMKNAKHIRAM